MSIILRAEKLYKEYKTSSGAVNALNGVDLSIEKGLFYAIIGRSGSGKSTLLHVLSGLDRPTSGKVLIDGVDMFSFSDEKMAIFRRRSMGFVFQQFNLLDEYSVLNNICMPLRLDGRKPDETFLAEVTKMLGIEEKLKKYPYELSGGEQQRVAIARSILAKPHIIFADEPTGNLDKKAGEDTLNLLSSCAARFGQTLIIVTHDLEIAKKADRIIKIEDGKIVSNQL
ncbi:MAG TPA: peptide ABC transporter ATP-binding protein [Clostridiales bacterium]|jgi:putative ABC transport system ATP-binding protein|nr:peptide ABC transporter ATP-binding protein [Clostridiales bacterium]